MAKKGELITSLTFFFRHKNNIAHVKMVPCVYNTSQRAHNIRRKEVKFAKDATSQDSLA